MTPASVQNKSEIKSFGAYEVARESLSTYHKSIISATERRVVSWQDEGVLKLLYAFVAMGGEVGEALNEIKKWIRDDEFKWTPERHEKLKLELGDVLWYLAACCFEMGFKLEDVATANIAKLRERAAANEGAGK